LKRVTQEEQAISEGCGNTQPKSQVEPKIQVEKPKIVSKPQVAPKSEPKPQVENLKIEQVEKPIFEESMEVTCPFCSSTFSKDANRELNRHIDQHLK
jgi:outer membrane biosynthesis protein TonB